jgi:hypothetical protein
MSATVATIQDLRVSTDGSEEYFSISFALLARPAGLLACREV